MMIGQEYGKIYGQIFRSSKCRKNGKYETSGIEECSEQMRHVKTVLPVRNIFGKYS